MTDDQSGTWLSPDDVFTDFGERVRRGYDPEVVDRHLERVADGIKSLRAHMESNERIDDESLQVMMRAGRRSVEEALEEAQARAAEIMAEAESESERLVTDAESKSEQLVGEAHATANKIRAAADDEARRQEETVEIRRIEVTALDEEIELRQNAVRSAAADLLRLADGIVDHVDIDLRKDDEAKSAGKTTS